ncbi:MAG: PDZ domain-containing protein [Pirellulaceae bacterium]|nr:PDZ domain-containing protein [Pirellulaceae bacterium]
MKLLVTKNNVAWSVGGLRNGRWMLSWLAVLVAWSMSSATSAQNLDALSQLLKADSASNEVGDGQPQSTADQQAVAGEQTSESNPVSGESARAEVREKSSTAQTPRVYLGLQAEAVSGGGVGVRVSGVTRDSPAWKAGFEVDDRILGINGFAIENIAAMAGRLSMTQPGQAATFLVNRAGRSLELTAVLVNAEVGRQLARDAEQPTSTTAWVGLVLHDLTESFRAQFGVAAYRGAAVTQVSPDSPAGRAGLQAGDAVVEVGGLAIETANDFQNWLDGSRPGDRTTIVVYRGVTRMSRELILGSPPQPQPTPLPRRLSARPLGSPTKSSKAAKATSPTEVAPATSDLLPAPIAATISTAEPQTPGPPSDAFSPRELEMQAEIDRLQKELASVHAKLAETRQQLDSILRSLRD